MVANFGI